ncbi:YjeF N-terminal domain-containing protein [Dichotomocladium elegans]|nr:YjeF N-terminal domain-containing protein [Dichotomocladium elegans]
MAEAFIGFVVSVSLQSGLKLTGTVAHIEPASQQMTLKDVELQFPNQPVFYTSVYGVFGTDIVDLQVVSQAAAAAGTKPAVTRSIARDVPHQKDDQPPTITIQQQGGSRQHDGKQSQQNNNGWADEDVNGFIEKEFDFQANLNMFDKKKVFAEIQERDDTAPETLLVTLNRLPRKPNGSRTNLLPTENVLDGEPKETSHKTAPAIRTADTHINCVTVSPLQMAHAEHECIKVTGPSEVQLIENGGRGVSALALQRVQAGNTPIVMVLTGNNKTGAYGVSTARHLANHGCHVVVCASEQLQNLCDTISMQESMFIRIGGDIIYDFDELNRWSPDLIIDAMVGSENKLMEQEDEKEEYEALRRMICWAGNQSAPVLSIDFPSAIGGGRGRSAEHWIRPRWTVCLGAPKTGCSSTDVTGTLYMADIGIPRTCWKRAGVKGWTVPWGASFVVELEYVS